MMATVEELFEFINAAPAETVQQWMQSQPPEKLEAVMNSIRQLRIERAREDPIEFLKFVMKDEETGKPIQQHKRHDQMQVICDEYQRAVILSHIESGKSNQITIGRTLYEIGKNPNIRALFVSSIEDQAKTFLRPVKEIIEGDDDYHAVFPGIVPSTPWQDGKIKVLRDGKAKDPTVRAVGVGGKVLGARLDWVVADDILSYENTRTPTEREKVWEWFHSTIMGRLTRNARVYMIGTAWHKQDILQRFARRKNWYFFKFPAINKKGKAISPDRWPQDRLDKAKRDDFTDLEWKRQIELVAVGDEETSFKEAYIKTCSRLGKNLFLCPNRESLKGLPTIESEDYKLDSVGAIQMDQYRIDPSVIPIFTGVDLAAHRTKRAAKTALFTIAVHPNGARQTLYAESGQWDGPTIRDKIIDTVMRFGSIAMVENNATQQWILDFAQEKDALALVPFTTGRNKADPDFGIETMATEFREGKWIIPCTERGQDEFVYDNDIEEWLNQLRDYDPQEHTGDLMMASWFARVLAYRYMKRKHRRRRKGGVRVIGG